MADESKEQESKTPTVTATTSEKASESEPSGTGDPKQAATVVMMRPCDGVPFEVFLVRRHSKSKFMPDAYVYPGGKMDDEDFEDTMVRHCLGVLGEDAARVFGVSDSKALGLYIAAIREVFEESGALLATENDGAAITYENPDDLDRYETYREALQDEEVSFHQIVGWEDLLLTCDELVYFAHWITPDIEPSRYDTRFFLTRAPVGQQLSHDDKETTDSLWITPRSALARYDGQEFQLAPPTLCTLEMLASFHSIDEALAYYRARTVPTILPHLLSSASNPTLLLPGDPEYPDPVEGDVDKTITRVFLANGRWWTMGAESEDEAVH